MNKYDQIGKLAQAAALIEEVLQVVWVVDPDFADDLQDIADHIANIADAIEGVE